MPSAEPTWRTVEFAPDARPDRSAGMSDSTMEVSWAVANPTPMPYTNSGIASWRPVTSTEISSVVATMPIASSDMPRVTARRGPQRCETRAAVGAATNAPMASARNTRPVSNAE